MFIVIAGGTAGLHLLRGWSIRMPKIGSFNRGVVVPQANVPRVLVVLLGATQARVFMGISGGNC